MKSWTPWIIALAALTASTAQAQKTTTVETVGPWTVLKTTDPMTDKISCFAALTESKNVQFSPPAIFISMAGKGGVSGLQYRLDDQAATQFELASPFERRSSILSFGDAGDVNRTRRIAGFSSAKRLRVQILTVLDNSVVYDIDMSSTKELLQVMQGPKCGGGGP